MHLHQGDERDREFVTAGRDPSELLEVREGPLDKVAPPFRQAEFDIMYGQGISREGSLLDVGVEHGIVKKSGAWYTYEGEQLGQGRENAKRFLIANPEVTVEIDGRIRATLGIGAEGEADDDADVLDRLDDAQAARAVGAGAD